MESLRLQIIIARGTLWKMPFWIFTFGKLFALSVNSTFQVCVCVLLCSPKSFLRLLVIRFHVIDPFLLCIMFFLFLYCFCLVYIIWHCPSIICVWFLLPISVDLSLKVIFLDFSALFFSFGLFITFYLSICFRP